MCVIWLRDLACLLRCATGDAAKAHIAAGSLAKARTQSIVVCDQLRNPNRARAEKLHGSHDVRKIARACVTKVKTVNTYKLCACSGGCAGARNYIGLNTKARAARVEGEPISRLAVCTHGRCHVWLLGYSRARACVKKRIVRMRVHKFVCRYVRIYTLTNVCA